MGILDQVSQMKNQGISEDQIINRLQEQGISPKAINDALNQSKIKDAVSQPVNTNDLEPSIMQNKIPKPGTQSNNTQEAGDEFYTPQPSNRNYQQMRPSTQEYSEGNEDYQTQDYFPQQQEYYPQGGYGDYYERGIDTDTMIEIAEQVFSEKIRKIQKQLEELQEFKTIAETKINHSTERLKRIEATMDKLQMAILEKVGSYGRGLENIKKEMTIMQDSFGKVINKITDKPKHKKANSKKK